MPNKLYVVHGSHPCVTVERALALKGVPYKTVELPPPAHAVVMRALFGPRTVPGIAFEDGTKVSGSRAILQELERRAPEPPLYPGDATARAQVEDAERWGDEVLQSVARRVLWPALQRHPKAIPTYTEGSKLPVPGAALVAMAPVLTRVERRMNDASDAAARADLLALPAHLDKVDAWIADGTLGGEQVNAADLQIAPSLRLIMSIGDLDPVFAGRQCAEFATRLIPHSAARTPAGVYPADWLPAQAAA